MFDKLRIFDATLSQPKRISGQPISKGTISYYVPRIDNGYLFVVSAVVRIPSAALEKCHVNGPIQIVQIVEITIKLSYQ